MIVEGSWMPGCPSRQNKVETSRSAEARGSLYFIAAYLRAFGANFSPRTRAFKISFVRAGQARTLSGVRLSCSASIIGSASTGAWIWFSAVQTPAGGEIVSMNPKPAITGALMRDVKFAVSKYSAVFITSGLPDGQLG